MMTVLYRLCVAAVTILSLSLPTGRASEAGDWPMWRFDAARSNASPTELPKQLNLSWVRQLPRPRPAWPASQAKLQFDAIAQPIVVGKLLIVGSTVNDAVTAYDVETGGEVWRFFTEGPVRFAPLGHRGRIYAASDDGYLYCLQAKTGQLLWKVRGGPNDRRVIGNDRLVSAWPIRGGPVLLDETVYFTASIWPFMGIFVHAVDAETGRTIWINSETGSRWVTHPHGAPSFGSIVPQGYLAASGQRLLVPGGRSLPGVFDRGTGKLLRFDFGGKGSGGWSVFAHEDFYVVHDAAFGIGQGESLGSIPTAAFTNDTLYGPSAAYEIAGAVQLVKGKDRKGKDIEKLGFKPGKSWSVSSPDLPIFAIAGQTAYSGKEGLVTSFDIRAAQAAGKAQPPRWSVRIEGAPATMLAGAGKLFVVTHDARVYCFGAGQTEIQRHLLTHRPGSRLAPSPAATYPQVVDSIQADGADAGYAIALGIGSGRLIEELAIRSQLQIIAVDADPAKVRQLRELTDAAGLYGSRVTACVGDPAAFAFPPYMADLVVSEELPTVPADFARVVGNAFAALRPYGGFACWKLTETQHQTLLAVVATGELPKAEVDHKNGLTYLRRVGSLPGSGSWTHQYADASNSVVSQDSIVKAPLGLLWFGGPGNDKVLPRHGHGPSPQVAGGRLVIEGADMLRCLDVYTGRLLWEKSLPGIGTYYDTTRHFPGAGEIGSNYVTLADFVYAVHGGAILLVNAATGKTVRRLALKAEAGEAAPSWGYLAAEGDFLIATSSPVAVEDKESPLDEDPPKPKTGSVARVGEGLLPTKYASSSRQLVVMNRVTGEVLWRRKAELSFRHNAIAAVGNRIYCIDGLSAQQLQTLARRGIETKAKPQLLALDSATGKQVWATNENVFGTFLNYSREHDVLLQAGSAYRDRAKDETTAGMVAYRGRDGKVLWQDLSKKYSGPCLLLRDKIITNGGGGFEIELLTGKKTGWSYDRMYGCNTAVGSQNLLTFRSGAAGYCDLNGDSGTGNIGGFRSSCTANLIVADGVLNAPDYTRTCTCAYQNQTSLALIHMPEVEQWTFSSLDKTPDRFASNFGAPGDRRGPDSSMWYDEPSVGGESPKLPVQIKGDSLRSVRHHSSRIVADDSGLPWVVASAVVGVAEVAQDIQKDDSSEVTVRLFFAELEGLASGERIFDVAIQGQPVLQRFDISREAGGGLRGIVKEFRGIKADGEVRVTFTNRVGDACVSGLQIISK